MKGAGSNDLRANSQPFAYLKAMAPDAPLINEALPFVAARRKFEQGLCPQSIAIVAGMTQIVRRKMSIGMTKEAEKIMAGAENHQNRH